VTKLEWQLRSCLSKKAYRTRKLALEATRGVRQAFGKQMILYKCKNCGCFHLATETN
jgi:hypothetical protein